MPATIDRYAFTPDEIRRGIMGEIVPPAPRTYARHAMLDASGKVIPIGTESIPLDVWAYVLDPETKEKTGHLKRVKMRTLSEVHADLRDALDYLVCDKCGARKVKEDDCYRDLTHHVPPEQGADCGGEFYSFIDEYFGGPDTYDKETTIVPHDYWRIAAWPVTGGSEGHYVHVEFQVPVRDVEVIEEQHDFGRKTKTLPLAGHKHGLMKIVRLALGKTFRGMAHAAEMAHQCAVLLGA